MAIVADVPARPDGLELIGEMVGSGYRTPPSLVRREDGQTLQLTQLLYAVLDAVDGRRGYAEIAELVSARTGRTVTASDVETLVSEQLRPRGLLLQADGTSAELERSNPLTALRFKLAVTDPALTRRITDPFTVLFHWWIWLPLLVVFGWVAWWLLMDRGLASAAYQAFAKPDCSCSSSWSSRSSRPASTSSATRPPRDVAARSPARWAPDGISCGRRSTRT